MATFNQIQVGRFNRFVQKLLSMKGPASLESLGPELFPVLSFFHGNENRYLEAWDQYMQGGNFVAGAGLINSFQLRNPVGSNIIIVVTQVFIATGGANNLIVWSFGSTTTDLSGLGIALRSFDKRSGRNSTGLISTGTAAAQQSLGQGNGVIQLGSGQSSLQVFNHTEEPEPILPGEGMMFSTVTVNIGSSFTVVWRERFLEDSERS